MPEGRQTMDTKFIRVYENGELRQIIINRSFSKEGLRKALEGGPTKEDIAEVLEKGIYIPKGESFKIVFSSKGWIHEHYGDEYAVTSFENQDEITILPDCKVTVKRHK